jgi:hypothetical protein
MDIEEVKAYVAKGLASFETDPPDSSYQRGFLAALRLVWTEALKQSLPHSIPFSEKPK